MSLNTQLAELDKLIAEKFSAHRQAAIITSMTGVGALLGAEFLAAAGDVTSRFESADHLAGYAGLAPTPRDSGTRSGNLHRPKRYNRQLQRVIYTSALISIQRSPASRTFYDRKRSQGNRHTQAVMALARRRANVLWARLRDHQTYNEPPQIDIAAA
jgi:transposase